MVDSELDRFPIEIHVKIKLIKYWACIMEGKDTKFNKTLYIKCISSNFNHRNDGNIKYKWLHKVKVY